MAKNKKTMTPAVRVLSKEKADFSEHFYEYIEHGGTEASSRQLNVEEHAIIKTLVMEDEKKNPMIVLMHGDLSVSTKNLARFIGAKTITPCLPDTATKHTGYQVGGTSPFGIRKNMKIYLEESILTLPKIYINGGKRGFLISLEPKELLRILKPIIVKVGIGK